MDKQEKDANAQLGAKPSDWIDGARGFLSIYVFIHHVLERNNELIYLPLKQGQLVVIIFFVLSGYLINILKRVKYHTKIGFIKNRVARIYSLLSFTFIISFILNKDIPFNIKALFGNLLNLQDLNRHPGIIVEPFLNNTPLWSLAYEVWFYSLFLLFWNTNRAPKVITLCITASIIFVLYPNQIVLYISYFIIWWAGFLMADTHFFESKDYKLTIVGLLVIIFIYSCQVFKIKTISISHYPIIQARHFISAILILEMVRITRKFEKVKSFFVQFLYPFSFFSKISFSFYLLHYPVIIQNSRDNLGSIDTFKLIYWTFLCLGGCYLIEPFFYRRCLYPLISNKK